MGRVVLPQEDQVLVHVGAEFEGNVGTVRSARRFVAATLTAWNLNHLKEAACLPVFAERMAVVGFILAIPILWTIGIILLVVGLIFELLGATGRAVGGRRHYY